jgi:tRNA pseudouridine55 synthase
MRYSSTEKTNGFFVIDKPKGLTSHDVVQAARRHLKTRRVGHLGTLDPMATGVLPLAIGKATRLAQFLSSGIKLYEGTIHLGYSTDTFDGEGRATSKPVVPAVTEPQLQEIKNQMLGEQLQIPPAYSAKKVAGVRSYELARQGIQLSLAPQKICISQFDLTQQGTNELDFEIHCSAGSYVRSVAHEVGQRLGCGAHLTSLRRTASGVFSLDRAVSLDLFLSIDEIELSRYLISMNTALEDLPELTVNEQTQARVAHGMEFSVAPGFPSADAGTVFRVLSLRGELLGVAEPSMRQATQEGPNSLLPHFHPRVVL